MVQLIADSGSTKCEWCLINNGKKKTILTQGISPYFLDTNQIIELLQKELLPKLKNVEIANIYFYGTGLSNVNNVKIVNTALKKLFKGAKIEINHDLLAAARALCGNKKGIACILGTGSNSCFFNGKKIVKNSPGLGYVLGDEGSGAYLGKKFYNTICIKHLMKIC
jgi:N-acetylglucosamine kinase-like BadF-type ATPase